MSDSNGPPILFVDRREDDPTRATKRSEDIAKLITPASAVQVVELVAGDVAFTGHGPNGCMSIGMEIKSLPDLIQSIQTNRFTGHQLPLLQEHYHVPWLLVEGQWRAKTDGSIEMWQAGKKTGLRPVKGKAWKGGWVELHGRQWLWKEIRNWLTTIEIKGGVRVVTTRDRAETARWCASQWWWWSKAWDDHKSHLAMKTDLWVGPLRKATLVEKMLLQLPGLGQEKARAAGRVFRTPLEMVLASEKEWQEVPGVGKITAARIVQGLTLRKGATK